MSAENILNNYIRLSNPDFDLENEFKDLYITKGIQLELIPHKLRRQGYFYDECIKRGRFDLIPQLRKNQFTQLTTEYKKKKEALNRVDKSTLKLVRVKPDMHFLRAYIEQAITSGYGISIDYENAVKSLNKEINELTEEELIRLCDPYIKYLYYFKTNEFDKLNYKNFPQLFTSVDQVSFDQGGLVKLQLFGVQISDLYTFDGKVIDGSLHDLDFMVNGKYRARSADNRPGFRICKYSKNEDMVYDIDIYGDIDNKAFELLEIRDRDRIGFNEEGLPLLRIENFPTPNDRENAKQLIIDYNTNWITSPELIKYYESDKELALLALKRNPLVFTVLSFDLRNDPDLQRMVCYYEFIMEYNFNLNEFLSEEWCSFIKGSDRRIP